VRCRSRWTIDFTRKKKLKKEKREKRRRKFRPFFPQKKDSSKLVSSKSWKILSSGNAKKEKKTHLYAKNKEKRERETGREREREKEREREIFRRRRTRDGFGKTRRHSKAFAGGARGERHRDRGETRWDGVRDLSFVFFSCSGAASHTRRAFRSFSFGFGFAEDKSFHSHPFLSLFVWRLQKKRRESNKPKTKRRLRSNCTETNESNATSKWWRKPPVVPMK